MIILQLKINPEYQTLLPKLPNDEHEALKQSIKDEGQHYPIVINEEFGILDGHNSTGHARSLVEPKVETRRFPLKLIEEKFVIETNL